MTGTNYFAENGGGTVIKLIASELAVSGNLTIMDGYAYQGGGISLDGFSMLAFVEPLIAGFYNNIADQGSAIYSANSRYGMIQVRPQEKYSLSNVTSINISLSFRNNTEGVVHRSFYAPHFGYLAHQTSPNLLFDELTYDHDRSQYAYTTLIDTMLKMDNVDKYISLANGFCIQPYRKNWKCGYLDSLFHNYSDSCATPLLGSIKVRPGQNAFSLHHQDPNKILNLVYCYNDSVRPNNYSSRMVRNASTLSYKFTHPSHNGGYYMAVFTDLNMKDNRMSFKVPVFQINVSDCPVGFSLKNGSCTCDSKLNSHGYICDIDTETITSPPGYWTGLEEREDGDLLLFHSNCHPTFCNSSKRDFHPSDDPAEACLGNGTGVLCGECKENYSVVFGSHVCYNHCTDLYLLTILAYALAGFLLVVLLFALRITVATGTINGLIFYANVLGIIFDQVIEHETIQNSNYVAFVRVFIALLNLDLGFPLCFYKGMTTAGKVGFQFLFPVYLWSMVGLLIFLSKYFTRLSELISKFFVQVLVTLFYLSFSKLLSTVIVIFSSSTVSVIKGPGNYTSRLVWYYDGNDYGSNTHVILLALAVTFTVLFLLPYALLVTFSSLLLRFRVVSIKFKPFIDAYSGPFKDKWRFWFGLRLWITILLFGVDGALEGTNTMMIFVVNFITVMLFMFLQNLVRPFKNRLVGALDLFFMVNYTTLLAASVPWTRHVFWWIYVLLTAFAALATVLIVVGHLIALSETCRLKCANMLQRLQYEGRQDYHGHYREVTQDDDEEDMDLFAAAEERTLDTY